jgi:hypothetical protein
MLGGDMLGIASVPALARRAMIHCAGRLPSLYR